MVFRKAVSPVIATLLLILIAVAAAVLVYVWVTGYASSVTASGTPELQERIKIDAVSYDASLKNLTVYVRNIGDVTVNITTIYVINATTETVVGYCTVLGGGILQPGDIGAFYINATEAYAEWDNTLGAWISTSSTAGASRLGLEEGITHIIKVATESGVEAAISFSYTE